MANLSSPFRVEEEEVEETETLVAIPISALPSSDKKFSYMNRYCIYLKVFFYDSLSYKGDFKAYINSLPYQCHILLQKWIIYLA